MVEEDYKQSLSTAVKELAQLLDRQEALEIELNKVKDRAWTLRTAVRSLAGLCNIDADKTYPNLFPEALTLDTGFTDAVRGVLKSEAGYWHTPVQIRNMLQESGFDIDKYSNPLASIHTILKRLVKSGEVDQRESFDNRAIFGWVGKKLTGKKILS